MTRGGLAGIFDCGQFTVFFDTFVPDITQFVEHRKVPAKRCGAKGATHLSKVKYDDAPQSRKTAKHLPDDGHHCVPISVW